MDRAPGTPTASSSANIPPNDSPPKYVPQFSAATQMILDRMKAGAATGTSSLSSIGINPTTSQPVAFDEMRRRVMASMRTSEDVEIPITPARKGGRKSEGATGKANRTPSNNGTPASGNRGRSSGRAKGARGTKRKRSAKEESESPEEDSDAMSKLGDDSDDEAEAGSFTEVPRITQSGRHIVKPAQFVPAVSEAPARKRGPSRRNQEQALCKRCGRGHSPQNNMIVFCDGCNLGWHQMCHDPTISEEIVKDEAAPWFCAGCSRKRSKKSASASTPVEEPKGVSWQGRSESEKRSYFASLAQPQLVGLLIQAVTIHPNLPVFPPSSAHPQARQSSQAHSQAQPNSRQRSHQPQQPFPPSAMAGLFSRAEANPHGPMNFIRKITPLGSTSNASTPLLSASQPFSSAPPTLAPQGPKDDSRDSTPASPPYPKAGTGLMSKLPPDVDDGDWLVDANDFDAFSHMLYNEKGEKIEENGVPVHGVPITGGL